jgi:hypothetical protein
MRLPRPYGIGIELTSDVREFPTGDHSGACSPIIETMQVGMFLDSGPTYGGRAYRDCIASAHEHREPIAIASTRVAVAIWRRRFA